MKTCLVRRSCQSSAICTKSSWVHGRKYTICGPTWRLNMDLYTSERSPRHSVDTQEVISNPWGKQHTWPFCAAAEHLALTQVASWTYLFAGSGYREGKSS